MEYKSGLRKIEDGMFDTIGVMPIIKSALKKLRQDRQATLRNDRTRRRYKKAILLMRKTPNAERLGVAMSRLDQAAKRHVVHRNKASRLKRNLARLLR